MKTMFKVAVAVFGLGAVILVGFHLVMLYGLTSAMRKVVLPGIKEQTGIEARVGRLSINVAGGMLYLDHVEVLNPEGFLLENLASVDRIEVEVDIPSLFKQKLIHVKRVEVGNAVVNVIRNQDGEFNIRKLQEGIPEPPPPQQPPSEPGQPMPEQVPEPGQPAIAEPEPLPEMLFDVILCKAKLRYVDFKLNQLDIALDLKVIGQGLSTQIDPNTPWGSVDVIGSLGNDKNSFKTDLDLRLAPVTDPNVLSFDLDGQIMEIDQRMLQSAYNRLGIRTSPFGIEPTFQCRENRFENSQLAIGLREIELEDKLADRLGGMGSIESLQFVVPLEGTLQDPVVDVAGALVGAIGGNTRSILDAWLKGAAAKEAGLEQPPESMADAAVEVLAEQVEEIGESETVKKVLKDLADGEPSATNAPPPVSSDTIVDILGEHVDEIGEDEALKEGLKDLGRKLFGR